MLNHVQPLHSCLIMYSHSQPFKPYPAIFSHFQWFPAISCHFQSLSAMSSHSSHFQFFPYISRGFQQFFASSAITCYFQPVPAISSHFQLSDHFSHYQPLPAIPAILWSSVMSKRRPEKTTSKLLDSSWTPLPFGTMSKVSRFFFRDDFPRLTVPKITKFCAHFWKIDVEIDHIFFLT